MKIMERRLIHQVDYAAPFLPNLNRGRSHGHPIAFVVVDNLSVKGS
jgi:hypothetical protein